MRAIEVIGSVDAKHQIQATVPAEVPQGLVRLIVLIPEEEATTADAITAAMDAVCAEVETSLDPALHRAAQRVLERSEW
jgi:acetaldehyde dehydrogenase (acetylating)